MDKTDIKPIMLREELEADGSEFNGKPSMKLWLANHTAMVMVIAFGWFFGFAMGFFVALLN